MKTRNICHNRAFYHETRIVQEDSYRDPSLSSRWKRTSRSKSAGSIDQLIRYVVVGWFPCSIIDLVTFILATLHVPRSTRNPRLEITVTGFLVHCSDSCETFVVWSFCHGDNVAITVRSNTITRQHVRKYCSFYLEHLVI